MEQTVFIKKALVLGGGGFIGSHLVKALKSENIFVVAVDLKYPEYWKTFADEFIIGDLRNTEFVDKLFQSIKFDEVYQLAADMGGAGYINTGDNDAEVMGNSILINVNVLKAAQKNNIKSVFFSSTACVYPEYNQIDPKSMTCREDSVYPAAPDTEYGWEKLFSERLYLAYNKNYGMKNKVARYHNVFGPYGTWDNGKEKAPAAICRKVAKSTDEIEIWGNGEQHRSFLYIDECIKATLDFYRENTYFDPINIGSERVLSINELVDIICNIAGKKLKKKYISGPIGVHARTSHNDLIQKVIGYKPKENLEEGLSHTYQWIKSKVDNG
jgi:nucleoside-diphosphate-sugar epimerase